MKRVTNEGREEDTKAKVPFPCLPPLFLFLSSLPMSSLPHDFDHLSISRSLLPSVIIFFIEKREESGIKRRTNIKEWQKKFDLRAKALNESQN